MSARTLAIAMAAAMNTLGRAAVADGGGAWSRGKKAKAKRRRLLATRRGR